MSTVFFTSDLHFHHGKVLTFAGHHRPFDSMMEHDYEIVKRWNQTVHKRDTVWVLGDVIFGADTRILHELNGYKKLVLGNHDNFKRLQPFFSQIYGLTKYKGYWLSHCPLHPMHLRGRKNIHGHLHHELVRDDCGQIDHNYINACLEQWDCRPVAYDTINRG